MKLIQFLKHELWQIRTQELPRLKAFWVRLLRIMILTSQGFTKSQIQQGASSLTYYTLLGLVPIAAMVIGLSRGFLFEDRLKEIIYQKFPEQEFILQKIFEFAEASIQQAHQGILAGLGLVLLFWSAIKILRTLEIVMNKIWDVTKSRSLARQFSDYLAMILICPVLVLASTSVTIYLSAKVAALGEQVSLFKEIGPVLFPFLNLLPYLLTSLLFTFVYIFMPNMRVRFVPALIAGLVTGCVYQLIQWAYLKFQIGVSTYSAIYGTFAALPLFLIWLHLSWVIILLGSKIAFAVQNVDAYEFVTEEFSLNHKTTEISSLLITRFCIKHFLNEAPPPTVMEISDALSIPLVLSSHLVNDLVDAGVLTEVALEKDEVFGYQPAKSVDHLTIKRVLDMIEARGESLPFPPSEDLELIRKHLEAFNHLIECADANVALKDL